MSNAFLCAAAAGVGCTIAYLLIPKRAKRGVPFELRYFPVMAKGLGPTLVAEYSGMPWVGNKDLGFIARGGPPGKNFADIKDTLPFGQLPLLTTNDGSMIVQTTAIINYIGMVGGIEGDGLDFAVSQMLIAEAEDIYAMLMQNCQPSSPRSNRASRATRQLTTSSGARSCRLISPTLRSCAAGTGFHATSPGGLYLFSILYQCSLVVPTLLDGTASLRVLQDVNTRAPPRC